MDDFNFAKPNRMYLNAHIIMPSAERTGLGNVAIFIDASGSVSRGEFTQFIFADGVIIKTALPTGE